MLHLQSMINLKTKLALFNLLSKLLFSALFIGFLPYIVERINILQTDNELIKKREKIIQLVSEIGIEPFITSDADNAFGSYNILKEEFISLERIDLEEDWNFIEISSRDIEDETIEYRVLNYSFRVDGKTYLLSIGKSLSSINYAQRDIKIVILILLLFFILITLFFDLSYTSRILRPLDRITGKLRSTSSAAEFDMTPVRTTTSDFYALDKTIRELMSKTDELFRKEREITVNISHELLTPLQVLRSKLENLLLQKEHDFETSARIEESLKTLHRLKTLVNSLLMIARIENRQYLKEDSFSLCDLLREVTEEIYPVAEDSGIEMVEHFSCDKEINKANRSLLFSMFYNVVNNAVRHTQRDGKVVVISEFNANNLFVSVSDTGKGMTEEQLRNIFSRFSRKPAQDEESTGIGLAITKSIADFHNISISVSSKPGEGTTFSFAFPENS